MWPFSRKQTPKPPRPVSVKMRGFDGANTDRTLYSWTTTGSSINQDIYQALRILRARARDLYYNNALCKDFIRKAQNNIIGPHGPTLQVRAVKARGAQDERANTAIETAWRAWAKRADATGLSFAEVLRLAVAVQERDGEYLLRVLPGYNNAARFAVQLIDPDFLDVELNDAERGIVMGVERDAYGAPVAYWLLTAHPYEWTFGSKRREARRHVRVPASEIYHGFERFGADQARGVPGGHAAFSVMRQLGGYEDAEVIAARVGASKMGFFIRAENGAGYDGSEVDDAGDIITDAEPGTFEQLPHGVGFQTFDPQHPAGNFPAFLKSMTRRIASGLGIAYHSLANDLEGVNYSSGRLGEQESRDNWTVKQQALFSMCDWVFSEWLKMQLTIGALPYGMADVARLNVPHWQGRRWAAVDPLKDINADIAAIEAGVLSRGDVIRKSGRDPDDVWAEIAAEQAKLKELGILAEHEPEQPDEQTPAEDDEMEDAA
jgi:lambda family phage portal protein